MNLGQLRTQFVALLNRNDCTTDLANQFIQMAQTRIERTLRVPGMEKIGTVSGNVDPITDAVVIPQDFLSLKLMYTPDNYGGQTLLEFKDPAHFFALQRLGGGITPRFYTRIGASFLLCPVLPPNNELTMVYYGAQGFLSADTDTNFFTDVAPDLLLYAALSFACDYFVDERTQVFEQRFTSLYADIDEQARMTDFDQSAMAVSPAYNMEY
jgi:hypothetical protein